MTPGPAPGRAADPVRTVFFGSGAFAVPILEAVAAQPRVELVGIVTAPDRPSGRGKLLRPTPVGLVARTMWAPLLQPGRLADAEGVEEVAALRPDLGVLADYGQIVPASVLALPRHGILNVHPSLLPRHRGATPVAATIAEGDAEGGVTVIQMDEGIDTGPIVAQQRWPLAGDETARELEARAAREGAALLARSIGQWVDGTLEALPQGEGATLTRTFRRDHARLDPSRPAIELERGVRARVPWPGSFLDTSAGRVLVHRASAAPGASGDVPGAIVADGSSLALATADGRLALDEVQLPGGRVMTGGELLRGHPELAEAAVVPRKAARVAAGATG